MIPQVTDVPELHLHSQEYRVCIHKHCPTLCSCTGVQSLLPGDSWEAPETGTETPEGLRYHCRHAGQKPPLSLVFLLGDNE